MPDTVLIPGGRDVRASLDAPDTPTETCVVACPPHPLAGGRRSDTRLRAVSDALAEEGIACLRFDYGEWADGRGELADARNALAWARDEYESVGLFGFSFGGAVCLLTAARASREGRAPAAVSALAPTAVLSASPDDPPVSDGLDAVAALDDVACPVQVVYGERDTTAEWKPVVERARDLGFEVEAMSADHFFVGQAPKAAARVAAFLAPRL
jgi:alpha/beta superfamily hydrolase